MTAHGFVLAIGAAALGVAIPAGADAQAAACAARDSVVARLATTYGESRQGIGLAANNQIVEIFASEATGTWTITVTMPSGMTCLVASGQAYERLEEALGPAESSL